LPDKIQLTIPDDVLDKIRYLCQKIADVEWSGPCFYKHEGSISDPKNFKITLTDVLPLDKGTKVYTEYKLDGDFVDYMIDVGGEDALDWCMGHCHSHNTFDVFFSGTDQKELLDNAPNFNFYLSLIVNNAGEMVARVAFAVTAEKTIHNVPLYGTNEKGERYIFSKESQTIKSTKFYYHDCDIIAKKEVLTVPQHFIDRVHLLNNPPKKEYIAPVYDTPKGPDFNKKNMFDDDYRWDKEDLDEGKNLLITEKTAKKDYLDEASKFMKNFDFDLVTRGEFLRAFLAELFSFGRPVDFNEEFFLEDVLEECAENEGEDALKLATLVSEQYGDIYAKHFENATAKVFVNDCKEVISILEEMEMAHPYLRVTTKTLSHMLDHFQTVEV